MLSIDWSNSRLTAEGDMCKALLGLSEEMGNEMYFSEREKGGKFSTDYCKVQSPKQLWEQHQQLWEFWVAAVLPSLCAESKLSTDFWKSLCQESKSGPGIMHEQSLNLESGANHIRSQQPLISGADANEQEEKKKGEGVNKGTSVIILVASWLKSPSDKEEQSFIECSASIDWLASYLEDSESNFAPVLDHTSDPFNLVSLLDASKSNEPSDISCPEDSESDYEPTFDMEEREIVGRNKETLALLLWISLAHALADMFALACASMGPPGFAPAALVIA
ncbi:hypothetical protein C8J57DRAFT_1240633 [Mycena rebaudengoi]|nr:hypothetical protein C8J57DRAFT_1240633 [Mycena rebaudengoi]